MRILLIHNYYQQRGGEDVAFESECELLRDRGHDVYPLIFNNENLQKSKVQAGINALYNKTSAGKVMEIIKEFHPDIIHLHNIFFEASPSVLFVAKKYNIPVILTLHNYRLICCNALLLRDNKVCELCVNKKLPTYGIKYKCYRNSATESALVTAVTGSHKVLNTWKKKVNTFITLTDFAKTKLLHSSLGAHEDQMVIKPNFINDPGNGAIPRENFFLYAGRISIEKGIAGLLNAFAGLPQHKLLLIGDGPQKSMLEKEFQQYPNISFGGILSRDELLAIMKRCKALIVPSIWYEVLPFVILEAFATGTPVFASNLGSLRDMITDGYNGIHFIPDNSEDIGQKIISFEMNIEQNQIMYANARQTYLDNYHPDKHYSCIINIYKAALSSQTIEA